MSAEVIQDSLKSFKAVFDSLTQSEKYDLLHLLIKKLTYFEDADTDKDGNRKGNIKLELLELPGLQEKIEGKSNDFAERLNWLPN